MAHAELLERHNGNVTPQSVDRFCTFRRLLLTAETDEQVFSVAQAYNVPFPDLQQNSVQILRKKTCANYFYSEFGQTSFAEHCQNMGENFKTLRNHLAENGSQSAMWLMGSASRGRPTGMQSDLDVIIALPDPGRSDNERDILEGLTQKGFVFGEKESNFDDLESPAGNGEGLARLFAITEDGIETEFFILGMQDILKISDPKPGDWIYRVKPTEPKHEKLASFNGRKEAIYKPADRVFNIIEKNNEIFKGFFVDGIGMGNLYYDPTGLGKYTEEGVWQYEVEGFLHNNEAVRNDGKATFERFQDTFIMDPAKFSEARLSEIAYRFYRTMDKVLRRTF